MLTRVRLQPKHHVVPFLTGILSISAKHECFKQNCLLKQLYEIGPLQKSTFGLG